MIKGLNFYKETKKSKKSLDDLNLFERAKRSYINQIALLNIGNIIYFELVEEFIPKEILVFEELKSLNVIEFAFIGVASGKCGFTTLRNFPDFLI